MSLSWYGFLLPVVGALVLLTCYILQIVRSRRIKGRYRLVEQVVYFIISVMIPKKQSRLYKFYNHILKYSRWNIHDVYKAKTIVFIFILLILILVKLTNISLYTKEILNKFDYHKDLIYHGELCLDETLAFKQEMKYFKLAIELPEIKAIAEMRKDQAEDIVKSIIMERDSELLEPRDAMANKVYYRVYDYYKCRRWNTALFILISFISSYSIELILLGYNFFAETESKKELRFLKKLIILNGSIKPVDFLKLLKVLREKAHYHKKVLVHIEELNKRNSVDNREIYQYLIKNTRNVEMKLFYEKLDQANNYEFNQAIINIENEFQMDRRAQTRKIKKQTELIHAIGITGFMALIFILILYMIIPWLEMYNMNQVY
jgi:hypothetical protein